MLKKHIKTILLSGAMLLSSQASVAADPINIALKFQGGTGCSTDKFYLDAIINSTFAGSFTLTGTWVSNSGARFPVQGTAILNDGENLYPISLITTSSTGETFTWGGKLDGVTFEGAGTLQRIAHGSIDSDCSGEWSLEPLLPPIVIEPILPFP